MGFTPREVDDMSIRQYQACVRGYNRAQGIAPDRPKTEISDDRLAEMGIEGF